MIRLFVLLLGCTLIRSFCLLKTEGFTLSSVTPETQPVEITAGSYPQDSARSFHYLGHGAQSFVFASDDGKYVLKLFREHRYAMPPWLKCLPLPETRERYLTKKNRKRAREYGSYALAATRFSEETGVVYLHLGKTETLASLQITDPLGIAHTLDPNHFDFLIQRRAEGLYDTLSRLITTGKEEEARKLVSQVEPWLRSRCQKGMNDFDANLQTNVGIIDGKLVQTDVGKLRFDPDLQTREEEIVKRVKRPFEAWLKKQHPELM